MISVWLPLTTTEKVSAHAQTYRLGGAQPPRSLARRSPSRHRPHAIARMGHVLIATEIALPHPPASVWYRRRQVDPGT